MSKIEDYNNQANITGSVIRMLREVKGLKRDADEKNPHNDKALAQFGSSQIFDTDLKLYFHAVYGYYGSSDAYAATVNSSVNKYIIKALNEYTGKIIDRAMDIAKQDERIALLDAKTEAEDILKKIESLGGQK